MELIGAEKIGNTSLGTSTTKTQLGGASVILPNWCKQIVAIRPMTTIDVPTVSETVHAKCSLESDDLNIGPFETLAAPLSSCLGATVAPYVPKPETYLVRCPTKGGEKIDIYGTALVANTAAPYMGVQLVISGKPPSKPQRFSKCGTLTDTGTTASTEVAGTSYSFSDCRRIVELMGVVSPQVVAAADAIAGYLRFESSEFQHATPAKLMYNPVPGGLSTIFSTKLAGVSRLPVNIPTIQGQVNIQDYCYMDLAPASTGKFVSACVFE